MKELKYKTIECPIIYNYIDKATDDSWEYIVSIKDESYNLLHIKIILRIKIVEDRIQKGMYLLNTKGDMLANLSMWKNIARLTKEHVKVYKVRMW